MGQKQNKEMMEGATGTAGITKRADRKVESNDSPEIPDRRETSESPSLPSGPRQKK